MRDGSYRIGHKKCWHTLAYVAGGILYCEGAPYADFHQLPVTKAIALLEARSLYYEPYGQA